MPRETEELINQIDLHINAWKNLSVGQGLQVMSFTCDECHLIRDALRRSLSGGKDADVGR